MSSNDAIIRSFKSFRMDVDELDERGASVLDQTVSAMSGYDNRSSEEIVDGANGSMDLSSALQAVQLRQSGFWQQIVDAWQNLAADLQKKVEDDTLSDSVRMSAVNQRKGLLQGLALVAALLQEATERVGHMDVQERSTLGSDAKKVVAEAKSLPAEVIAAKTTENKVTEKQIADNTVRAIEFLSKGAK